jgi:hypothetical protein
MMPYSFERLRNTVASLRAQTIRQQIEVILVHRPDGASEVDAAQFREFHSFRLLELPADFHLAEGFAAGFAAATAPALTYVEDHVTLNPEWAAVIVEAHRGPWVAVAPAMENANDPRSTIARAAFLAGFVWWYGEDRQRQISSGPGHNTTYKRSALEPFRSRLIELYASERNLCYLLEANGGRMVIEPRAVARHFNISKFRPALAHAYYGGKVFGGHRASTMGPLEKLARTLIAPAIPPLLLTRIIRTLRSRRKTSEIGLLAALPVLIIDLILHAIGEVAGYWGGSQSAMKPYRRLEMDRLSCLVERDTALMFSQRPTHGH